MITAFRAKAGRTRWMMSALYVAAGVGHLTAPDLFLSITPSWVPWAPQVIMLTGVFELLAAAALLTRTSLRWWAGMGLALYALCVWPANFKHAFDGVALPHLPSSWLYHGPRLALQPVLIWWALYCG
eukprot:gene64244-87880_t